MRDVNEIHPEMFWQSAELVGITLEDRERIGKCSNIREVLSFLKASLLESESDTEVMGLLLGLEMPAVENIETVFSSLEYKDDLVKDLACHVFFRLHRVIENEHVRLTVSNFLRFCNHSRQKQEFIRGFDKGIEFWSKFWSEAIQEAKAELLRGKRSETN